MKEVFRADFVVGSTQGQSALSKNGGWGEVGWWSRPVVVKTESGTYEFVRKKAVLPLLSSGGRT
jgi:hypothetical protein